MKTEMLRVFDENGKVTGIASREEVHQRGYWHETFHCWIISRKDGKDCIHLQLRSPLKKDFPSLFDITAAGHLASDETVKDGIREVEEELGLAVAFEDFIPLGIIKDEIREEEFLDNERCHNFLYRMDKNPDAMFELQKEEVAGMTAVEFTAFADLCLGKREQVVAEGFEVAEEGSRKALITNISLDNLVPHSRGYLEEAVIRITRELER